MRFFAQLDADGVAHTISQHEEAIEGDVVELETEDVSILGKRWTGAAWEDAPVPEDRAAQEALAAIDAQTGMSRTLRETLLAIAGDKAPAELVQAEATAEAHRAVLASAQQVRP